MRCDGAMAPTVIHRSCLLGITKEDLLTKITALAKEKLTIDKNPTCHESSAVQLLRWGILNSLDPHNSRDLLLLFYLEDGAKCSYFYYLGKRLGFPHKDFVVFQIGYQ